MESESGNQWRIVLVSLATLALFSALVLQFYRLQVTEHPKWLRRAQVQQKGIVKEPFRRGRFWSNVEVRPGHPHPPQPLVLDIAKYHLHADPANIGPELREEISRELARLSGTPSEDAVHVERQLHLQSRNRQLLRWLDRKTRDDILSWWNPFAKERHIPRNALFFVADRQRSYPFGSLLGQVLHTIRDIKEESTNQGLPTGGLESYFDALLRGREGRRWIVRSPRHFLAMGDVIEPALDGADIYLTINHHLQAIAEEEIAVGVAKSEAKAGWAIVMNPHTGEVLALAQHPSFEPSRYRDYFNDPERICDTCVQGITYPFEPGSPMKPLNIALYLTANEQLVQRGEPPLFDPDVMINVTDGKVPGRSRPLADVGTYRFVNMRLALQKSSNIYMGKIAQRLVERMGPEWYAAALRERFGFGSKTGIELPGETAGFTPFVGKSYPSGAPQWSGSTPYSLAMGYNILASSLQMLRAYCAIANGGLLVQPTLVRSIVRQRDGLVEMLYTLDERLVQSPPPRILSEAVAKEVMQAMKYVTKRGGSAANADLFGYTEAGKSGTTEKLLSGSYSKRMHFSSFIGFTPASDPKATELVIGVFIDEPSCRFIPGFGAYHRGGKCAAEVFHCVGKRSLEYLGIAPDDPFGYPVGDPRRDVNQADWVFEADQLQEIYNQWNPPAK